jgi:hypothetical protein
MENNRQKNWYKIAKKEKSPYKVYLRTPGGEPKEIGNIDAHSEAQAKKLFLDKKPQYRDYLTVGMGCFIDAVLDREELERRLEVQKYEKEREEEVIQNAWWNK